eukprot:jgi/Botrbrau1/18967/Bobra.0100s0004.1
MGFLLADTKCNDRDSYPGLRGPSEESYQLGRVCHVPKRYDRCLSALLSG